MFQKVLVLASLLLIIGHVDAQKNKKVEASATSATQKTDLNTTFSSMKWRSIGPFRGGRSVAASGVVGDITTYYMGTTGGGVWKTDDLGNNWTNISDGFFSTGSVGAITVAESDPNIIYVGMGEHPMRGVMTHHGDGVYKSTDAGKTWKKMGLELTQHIARIVVHPKDPSIVFVAAQGPLYSKSPERGIFKSTDGGNTWKKVLYVDESTGCAEISMDMNNPLIIYAAMWEHGRKPWKVISGGPGSGLYKSVDGGETWNKINSGLPDELGKMAIAVCRSNSEKVYALVESDSNQEKGGLFVSQDSGANWSRVSDDHRLVQRAWYYIEVFTDPLDENTVYVLSAPALRSTDGGVTWENIDGVHGDYHNLWINPTNPKNMAISDDGGTSITVNNGKTWSTHSTLPIGQMYRISVDNGFPYKIYAGQQDYSSVVIASQELGNGGISTDSWTYTAGGESAFLAFDPDNPELVMGGSYLGTIEILNTKAKAATNVMAAPIQYLAMEPKKMKYRYNWNAPIIWSKHEPGTFYHGAQVLLRTKDMGITWTEVSPDLTRNDKEKQGNGGGPYTNEVVGAENYGTLSYVIESPHEKGVIWTGSDDGLVYVTKDGGGNWTNVTPAGLTECLINAIEVSPHDPATAYIATTRYKFNDHIPGLFKTTDYGKTWTNISQGIPSGAFTRVIREDNVRKDLLVAGTETGVYLSWDGGKHWSPFQLNLPITPITDLKIHQGDLIAATSGRSFWILDDMSVLRQYSTKLDSFFVFKTSDAMLINGSSELDKTSKSFTGSNPTRGVNPATGAVIYYQLPTLKDEDTVTLTIKDASGRLVRTFSSVKDTTFTSYDGGPPSEPVLSAATGINRFVWNLRHQTMPGVGGVYIESSYRGHKVVPGTYTMTLQVNDKALTSTVDVLANPLYPTTQQSYGEYTNIMQKMEFAVKEMHDMTNTLYTQKGQIAQILSSLPKDTKFDIVRKQGNDLLAKLTQWDEDMVQRKSKAYDDVENYPNKFTANYMYLMNQTESDIPQLNQPSIDLKKILDAEWAILKNNGKTMLEVEIPSLNKALWDAGVGAIWKK